MKFPALGLLALLLASSFAWRAAAEKNPHLPPPNATESYDVFHMATLQSPRFPLRLPSGDILVSQAMKKPVPARAGVDPEAGPLGPIFVSARPWFVDDGVLGRETAL